MLTMRKEDVTEWKDWEIFCRIVELGSFSAASERTGLPKSTISSSLARLEHQLGLRLLDRNTRNVRVTDVGKITYTRVAPLFVALHEVEADTKSINQAVTGVLRVSASNKGAWTRLSLALGVLLAEYRDLRVEIDDGRAMPDLVGDQYDLALVEGADQLPDSSLVSKRVDAMDRALYASMRAIEEWGTPSLPVDLESWPAILDTGDTYWDVYKEGQEKFRVRVKPRVRTPNTEIRLEAALQGLGVARLATRQIQCYIDSGDLVRVLPQYRSSPVNIYAVIPSRRLMPPKVRALLRALEATGYSDAG